MADRTPRALVVMLVLQLGLVVALLIWAASGFPLPGAISGGPRTPAVSTASDATPATQPPSPVPRATVDRFPGKRAFALLREQVEDYGWRPAGSSSLRRLSLRLRSLLPRGRFEAIPGDPRLRNVVGSIPGRGKAILVGAHYDVEARPRGFVGANDGAAGTAAVVWLARALAAAPRRAGDRPLRFVLFDGEEEPPGCVQFSQCALRGSKADAERNAVNTHRFVLLDYIAEKDGLLFAREGTSSEPLWAQLRTAAADVGTGALFPDAVGGGVIDDHSPFLDRGVRAIDIIDFEYPHADTLRDTVDKVSERSLDAVGETVYRLLTRLRRER